MSVPRPRGTPPMPSARSRASAPVETASMSICGRSPIFMTEPFPNCSSIWLIAASIAFCLSICLSISVPSSSSCQSPYRGGMTGKQHTCTSRPNACSTQAPSVRRRGPAHPPPLAFRPSEGMTAMPYAEGRTYFDADSHIMELHDWLRDYVDDDLKPQIGRLQLGGAGALAEQAVADAEA